jgi:hypothetical protein
VGGKRGDTDLVILFFGSRRLAFDWAVRNPNANRLGPM